jgi:cysteine desulfurase
VSIYLDYNATAPLLPEVEFLLKKSFSIFGNPSSLHKEGRKAWEKIDSARQKVAASVDTDPTSIIFTSSGTESNNTLLKGLKPRHLIISSIEHPCISKTADWLAQNGTHVSILEVDSNGKIKLESLESLITDQTDLISIMLANNETGTIQPIKEVVQIAQKYHIPVHTDAVQAWQKMDFSFTQLGVDYMSLSGHKIGAPKGIGVLISKNPKSIPSLLHGGPQETQHRAGTENTLGIIGLEAALKHPLDIQTLKDLKTHFLTQMHAKIDNVVLNGDLENSLYNTLNLSFLGVSAEALMMRLDLEGIYASTGSACSSGSTEPSTVLTAMGLSQERVQSAVRFSFGPQTTKAKLDQTLEVLTRILPGLRWDCSK